MNFKNAIFLICFFASCASENKSQVNDVKGAANTGMSFIEWSEQRKLTWQDFKGSPPPDKKDDAAGTYCGFGYKLNAAIFMKPVIKVNNRFDSHLSWVREDQKNRKELLQHEQLHFDISELYARQLRKEFSSAKLNYFNIKKSAEKKYQKVYDQYMQRQQEYEQKTSFSLNSMKQAEWSKQIKAELDILKDFKQ